MKVIYQLETKEEIVVEGTSITDVQLDIEDANVVFKLDSGNIMAAKVSFGGLPDLPQKKVPLQELGFYCKSGHMRSA